MSAVATKLSSFLVAPTRVASILDWKRLGGTVMALDISSDRIGVAISGHPARGESVYELDPIQILKGSSSSSADTSSTACTASRELEDVVKEERVCALVVRWPLQPGGRMGGPCGRVLHTLESLTLKNGNGIVGKNRPFTLWDDRDVLAEEGTVIDQDVPDEWGRLAVFGRAPAYSPDMLHSSRTQTRAPVVEDSSSAAKILEHFLRDNWQMSDLSNERNKSYGVVAGPKRQAPRKAFVAESTSIDEGGEQVYISQSLL